MCSPLPQGAHGGAAAMGRKRGGSGHGQPSAMPDQAKVLPGRSGAPKAQRKEPEQVLRAQASVTSRATYSGEPHATPSSDPESLGAHVSWSPHPSWAGPPPLCAEPRRLWNSSRGCCQTAHPSSHGHAGTSLSLGTEVTTRTQAGVVAMWCSDPRVVEGLLVESLAESCSRVESCPECQPSLLWECTRRPTGKELVK